MNLRKNLHAMCLLPMSVISSLVLAQTPPNAGSLLRQIVPPTTQQTPSAPGVVVPVQLAPAQPPDQGVAFSVRQIQITGSTIFSESELLLLVSDMLNAERSLVQLQEAAARITARYRAAGYLLARAYLPQQKIENGLVSIVVLEGKLADIKIENVSHLSAARAQSILAEIDLSKPANQSQINRAVLLLGDTPGVGAVDTRLSPGTKVGETVLTTRLNPVPYASGRLELDNYGGLYTGRYRVGASVDVSSPFGFGERFSARLMGSDSDLLYGRLAAQLPVGSSGVTVGTAIGRSTYALGDTFATLDAVGRSTTSELFARYPLVRSVPLNVYGQVNAEHRSLRDEVRSTSTQTDKKSSVGSVALQADWRDRAGGLGANSQASATLTGGKLRINSVAAAAIDAAGANTVGSFSKVGYSLSRQQELANKLSLSAQVRGQWANKNLDSSEKFSLGGASGVRAYPSGEASGDSGWMGSLELRYALMQHMAVSVFYDAGSINVNANPYLKTENKRSLAGSGLGLTGAYDAWDWRLAVAWRNAEVSVSEPDKSPRVWLQVGWRF